MGGKPRVYEGHRSQENKAVKGRERIQMKSNRITGMTIGSWNQWKSLVTHEVIGDT